MWAKAAALLVDEAELGGGAGGARDELFVTEALDVADACAVDEAAIFEEKEQEGH